MVCAAFRWLQFLFHCFTQKIQTSAARLLSMLFVVDFSHSSTFSNASFGLDDKQVWPSVWNCDYFLQLRKSVDHLRLTKFSWQVDICKNSIYRIISEQLPWSEDLIVATLKLLIFSARYQVWSSKSRLLIEVKTSSTATMVCNK